MNKQTIIGIAFLFVGILVGGVGYHFLARNNSINEQHVHAEGETLYTCGMHPNIVETEPGTCPICGMNLTPIKNGSGKKKSSGERKILYWRAPMDPNEIYDSPGKSKMGMDLVPVYEDEAGQSGTVTVDGSVLQSMNVKIIKVEKREVNPVVITNGVIRTDETKEYIVNPKFDGWIEKLYINYTGQEVKKGDKLLDVYSPKLVAAQQEVLTLLNYSETENNRETKQLLQNAITKLELFDVPQTEIDRLIKTKKIKRYLTFTAPFNGTVINKNVVEGERISANKQLLKIADLRNLWLLADIYEGELNKVNLGDKAEIRFSYNPAKVYNGVVSFIYPTVDPLSRTVQVRINLKNDGQLKPAMFANVMIKSPSEGKVISIPETAVIRSGIKSIVVLSLGEGRFKPIEVKLGRYSDGYYEVLSGLKLGDEIVHSGQFMIDSESSLRASVQLFSSSTDESKKNGGMKDMKMQNDNDSVKSTTAEKTSSQMEHNHENSMVHKGVIDVRAIDKNGDGKVFQDFMDWNVISDEDGRCPLCGMYLKEVTIKQAEENLISNGYKIKK